MWWLGAAACAMLVDCNPCTTPTDVLCVSCGCGYQGVLSPRCTGWVVVVAQLQTQQGMQHPHWHGSPAPLFLSYLLYLGVLLMAQRDLTQCRYNIPWHYANIGFSDIPAIKPSQGWGVSSSPFLMVCQGMVLLAAQAQAPYIYAAATPPVRPYWPLVCKHAGALCVLAQPDSPTASITQPQPSVPCRLPAAASTGQVSH